MTNQANPSNPAAEAPAQGTTTPAAKAPEPKTVLEDMDSRRMLANPTEATAYIAKCMTDYADFGVYAVAAPGISIGEAGTENEGALIFDPEVYTEGTRVMVSVLTQRGDGPGTSTVKAIVIAPAPSFEQILADKGGRDWAERILDKELNHVAVRGLRKADSIEDAIPAMPKTLADYITSDRGGGILTAYEELWRRIKNNMGKLSRPWRLANLSKKELRRCLESAAYAGEYYPTLEQAKQGSLFVFALNGLIATAKKEGLDYAVFERWLANRNETQIDVKDDEDDDGDFDLAALESAMATPEKAADLTQNEGESDEDFAKRKATAAEAEKAPELTDEQVEAQSQAELNDPDATPEAEMTDEELEAATAPDSTAAPANEEPPAA